MKVQESVILLCENYVKQLEGLAYSKNRDLALKLVGEIDACITITEISGDAWNTRVNHAIELVMKDKPKPQDITQASIPAALMQHTPAVGMTTPGVLVPAGMPQLPPSEDEK